MPVRIQIDVKNNTHEEKTFNNIYELIPKRKKKEVLQKALIFFLKNGNENTLKKLLGDKLEEVKEVARGKAPKIQKVFKKEVKTETRLSIKETFKKLYSDGKLGKLNEKEELGMIDSVREIDEPTRKRMIKKEVVENKPPINDVTSSGQVIWNILKSSNTSSSTTKEKKGKKKESVFKETKKKDEKSKLKEVSEEQLKLNKEKFLTEMEMEIEERKRISKEKRIASDKEMEEFFARLRRERKENKGK